MQAMAMKASKGAVEQHFPSHRSLRTNVRRGSPLPRTASASPPLRIAAARGHAEVVEQLVRSRAHVEQVDLEGAAVQKRFERRGPELFYLFQIESVG